MLKIETRMIAPKGSCIDTTDSTDSTDTWVTSPVFRSPSVMASPAAAMFYRSARSRTYQCDGNSRFSVSATLSLR